MWDRDHRGAARRSFHQSWYAMPSCTPWGILPSLGRTGSRVVAAPEVLDIHGNITLSLPEGENVGSPHRGQQGTCVTNHD